jgi:DNA processing protein
MDAHEAYIALNMMEGIGPVKTRALVEALGSPEAIFSANATELSSVNGVGPKLAQSIVEQQSRLDPAAEIAKARKLGFEIVTMLDEDYPDSLRQIHDPPLALYIQGRLAPRDRHAIGVVGSRHCTHYGMQTADRLSYQLAQTGFTVVSGLARGIDQAAHSGALKAKGRTIAVIGSALDRLYPPEADKLAEQIARSGAVISEFPLGREADRTTFPYRNRLIAGLSMGVLVVEASPKSGALMTSDAAMDQGKSVFAVPGRIDTPSARGSNNLLKQGAKLVDDLRDIVEDFEFLFAIDEQPAPEKAAGGIELSDEERIIADNLLEGEKDVDSLSRDTGLKSSRLSVLLLGLEMKRLVKMLPGKRVALNMDR